MLEDLVAAALKAGAAILTVYAREDFAAAAKSDGSPVTEADEKAEAIILEALAKIAPNIPVVAEESAAAGRIPATAERFFLVDPLDGTKEFISKNGDFTVNIALIENGAPVLGVVHTPAYGEVFVGVVGEGAKRAKLKDGLLGPWSPLKVRAPGADLDVVASRSHMSAETQAFVDRFSVRQLVNAGSSLKFCKLAAGEADLYPRLGRTMEWDTAAGDAVLRAAGGLVRTLDGKPLVYGKRGQADDADFANPWFVASGPFDPFTAAPAALVSE
jgi:3'(2'), 5'-bisphosphate nucleotidase